jgi:hypothetical protein
MFSSIVNFSYQINPEEIKNTKRVRIHSCNEYFFPADNDIEWLEFAFCDNITLSDHIGNLKNLKCLILYYCNNVKIDSSINQLQFLTKLKLLNCELSDIPKEISKLPKLAIVELSDNKLNRPTSYIFENFIPGEKGLLFNKENIKVAMVGSILISVDRIHDGDMGFKIKTSAGDIILSISSIASCCEKIRAFCKRLKSDMIGKKITMFNWKRYTSNLALLIGIEGFYPARLYVSNVHNGYYSHTATLTIGGDTVVRETI